MSRLAKQPIAIPAKTEVSVKDGDVMVKGPKGTLMRAGNRFVKVEIKTNTLAMLFAVNCSLVLKGFLGQHNIEGSLF